MGRSSREEHGFRLSNELLGYFIFTKIEKRTRWDRIPTWRSLFGEDLHQGNGHNEVGKCPNPHKHHFQGVPVPQQED